MHVPSTESAASNRVAPFNDRGGALTFAGRHQRPPCLYIPTGPEPDTVDPQVPGRVRPGLAGPRRRSVCSPSRARGDTCVAVEEILLMFFNRF